MERKETRPLSEFLEKDVSELYTMPQPYSFRGRLKVIKDFSYTISTKQMRVPNSGIIDDSDIDKLEGVHPRRKNCTSSKLYKQAGNSIVVNILMAIIKVLI